jgi:hypothetical protein
MRAWLKRVTFCKGRPILGIRPSSAIGAKRRNQLSMQFALSLTQRRARCTWKGWECLSCKGDHFVDRAHVYFRGFFATRTAPFGGLSVQSWLALCCMEDTSWFEVKILIAGGFVDVFSGRYRRWSMRLAFIDSGTRGGLRAKMQSSSRHWSLGTWKSYCR